MRQKLHTRSAVALLLAQFAFAFGAVAAPTVHFELRLAPGQDDAVLTLGDANDDTLEIEVWAEISGADPDTFFKAYFIYPRVSQGGVITMLENEYDSPLFDGILGCVFDPIPNSPQSGDLSVGCIADGDGVLDGVGSPALIATFNVQAEALGTTSYSWASNGGGIQQWGAFVIVAGSPLPIALADSNCGDGFCDVTGSVEPALAVIEVVDAPQVPRSPDADDDGDVDASDYAWMQRCADMLPGTLGNYCLRMDLTYDEVVDGSDMMAFTTAMTGIRPPFGDVDGDYDIDLADYALFQLCRGPNGDTGIEDRCTLADTDRDGSFDSGDLPKLVERLSGPKVD
ncbi:MAG: hypothetical protein H6817_02925 [Phycisphaerales bacterium]|nr:hypothetical protein [Phycisphaerales bacterium]